MLREACTDDRIKRGALERAVASRIILPPKHVSSRLCAVRRTGPFSHTGAAGTLRRAGTAVRSVGEADSVNYSNRTSSSITQTCRGP